jgi:hypothetical protein
MGDILRGEGILIRLTKKEKEQIKTLRSENITDKYNSRRWNKFNQE